MNKQNKRKKNRKNLQVRIILGYVAIFVMLLILPTVCWGALSVINIAVPSVMENLDFDTGENRTKAELQISDGLNSVFADVEKWYNDRVPFRSVILSVQKDFWNKFEEPYVNSIRPALINLFHNRDNDEEYDSSYIDSDIQEIPNASEHKYQLISVVEPTCTKKGVKVYKCKKCDREEKLISDPTHTGEVIRKVEASVSDYGYTLNRCTVCGSEYRSEITNRLPDSTYLPLINHNLTVEGKHNWLFYNGENSLAYYQAANKLTDEQMQEYTNALKKLKDVCDEKGIQLQYMIMPNKEQVYSEFMPDIEVQEGKKRAELLVDYVKTNSGIDIVYPLEALKEAKPYWQLYRKHDTHWNSAGAFIGTQELYKSLGVKTTELMTLKVTYKQPGEGDLIKIGALSSEVYAEDTNYSIKYRSGVKLTFESGEKKGAVTRISESTSSNKCNFVMIGDSFRTAMIPFLEKDFSKCTITHKNNIEQTVVKEAIRNADVLVVATVERQDQSWLNLVRTITNILSA